MLPPVVHVAGIFAKVPTMKLLGRRARPTRYPAFLYVENTWSATASILGERAFNLSGLPT